MCCMLLGYRVFTPYCGNETEVPRLEYKACSNMSLRSWQLIKERNRKLVLTSSTLFTLLKNKGKLYEIYQLYCVIEGQ